MRPITLAAMLMMAGTGMLPGNALADDQSHVTSERQMTLPAGQAFLQAFVEMNLSADAAFKPVSIAPDIWYGVSDVLTVGLVHSGRGATGFFGGVGNGLCITGEDSGCAKVYDNVGLEGRYHFHRSDSMTISAAGGLFANSFDPFLLSLKAGVIGRWQSGPLAVEFAPALFAGLTERSPEPGTVMVSSNKEILSVPVGLMYAIAPTLALGVQTGIVTPLEDAGDLFLIPLSAGVQYIASDKLVVDLVFSLPALAGGPDGTGADFRTLTLGVGYAL